MYYGIKKRWIVWNDISWWQTMCHRWQSALRDLNIHEAMSIEVNSIEDHWGEHCNFTMLYSHQWIYFVLHTQALSFAGMGRECMCVRGGRGGVVGWAQGVWEGCLLLLPLSGILTLRIKAKTQLNNFFIRWPKRIRYPLPEDSTSARKLGANWPITSRSFSATGTRNSCPTCRDSSPGIGNSSSGSTRSC